MKIIKVLNVAAHLCSVAVIIALLMYCDQLNRNVFRQAKAAAGWKAQYDLQLEFNRMHARERASTPRIPIIIERTVEVEVAAPPVIDFSAERRARDNRYQMDSMQAELRETRWAIENAAREQASETRRLADEAENLRIFGRR